MGCWAAHPGSCSLGDCGAAGKSETKYTEKGVCPAGVKTAGGSSWTPEWCVLTPFPPGKTLWMVANPAFASDCLDVVSFVHQSAPEPWCMVRHIKHRESQVLCRRGLGSAWSCN